MERKLPGLRRRKKQLRRRNKKQMKISILTICPEMFGDFSRSHAVVRAARQEAAELEIVDIRSFAPGSFRQIDDSPFGGGRGMVLRCRPVLEALKAVRRTHGGAEAQMDGDSPGTEAEAPGRTASSGSCRTVVLAPAGTPYTQEKAHELAGLDHLILICGHYEGFDARILNHADEMISAGDYVLTGGELPAMIIADSVLRLLPGILKSGSAEEESFENGLLEYPQYTQPAEYEGMKVPEVLLSGDHARIRRWRLKESIRLTYRNRPDLLKKRGMNEEEQMLFCEVLEEEQEAYERTVSTDQRNRSERR